MLVQRQEVSDSVAIEVAVWVMVGSQGFISPSSQFKVSDSSFVVRPASGLGKGSSGSDSAAWSKVVA